MMRALYTGESALKSHQTRMDVIGNNISNVNTVGFKSSRTTFEDILSQNLKDASASNEKIGSTNVKQIGLGVNVASTDLIFKNGAPIITGKNTDLALSGDGLFVVRRGNQNYYTRDGAFEFDSEGNYVLPSSGDFVQGWMAKNGVIDTTNPISDIKVEIGQSLSVNKTISITEITVEVNETVSFGGKSFSIQGIPADGNAWTFSENVPLGATTAQIENGYGNTATVRLVPANTFEIPKGQDVDSPTMILTKGSVTPKYPLTVKIGDNQYTAIGMDNDLSTDVEWSLKSGGATAGSNTITITDGTNDITFTLNSPLEETIGQQQVTTAVASESNPVTLTFSDGTTAVKTDGTYEVGDEITVEVDSDATLQEIQLDSSGIIIGTYTNGLHRTEAQVAVAHFTNFAALTKIGANLYQENMNSGVSVIDKADEFGVVITPGALEMSNVDIGTEFTDMIISQRGFQANAKLISVGDEMIETAISTKR